MEIKDGKDYLEEVKGLIALCVFHEAVLGAFGRR